MGPQMANGMVDAGLAAGATRSKAKNDPALALEALGQTATPTPTPAQ